MDPEGPAFDALLKVQFVTKAWPDIQKGVQKDEEWQNKPLVRKTQQIYVKRDEEKGSILGPLLFNIFISDLADGMKCTLMKCANNTKLSGEVDTWEGRTTLQEDLDRPEDWTNKNLMKFNKDKYAPPVFQAVATEEHPTQKLNWKTDSPVWAEQWLLSKEKLKALQELVDEQLAKGHIVETTSLWNSPVFVIKKTNKGKWRLLHDLRQINNVIEDMGSLQPGMPSPVMLPQNWNLAIIDIKDCFFQIPLHPDDAPRFAFLVPTLDREAPRKRYHWKFLPQGMKHSPSICQWYLSSLLSPVRAAVGEAIILHYMDDVLVCAPNDDLLSHALDLTIDSLVAAGFELQEEKIQRMPPWKYLGQEIGKQTTVPQKLVVKNNIKTLADVQQLCESINWPRATEGLDALAAPVEMAPLPNIFGQAKISHQLFHQNAPGLVRQFHLTREKARAIVSMCPSCQQHALPALSAGANLRGLNSCEVWQTDVTYIMSFGRQRYVHVSVDTFSGAVYASAHSGEKSSDAMKHLIQAFSFLGIPKSIKTDNGPTYTSKQFRSFLQQWGVEHKTGIPYSPTGQAIVERTHQNLKRVLSQQHQALKLETPQNQLSKALFTLNFLNCTFENLNPPIVRHFRELPTAAESKATGNGKGSSDQGNRGSS
ncbi:hypothetical protein DUI87_00854 [Hirundo rustica rustica]|uniref:Uncharacterized protein n=1 Tax=Hirundo rustica rustica TaxID=333673 RepID=A0A3M0L3K2_HIRRU|nr:hypothetical protein DUI87_00854 [Hirundo rustica rustica]